MGEPLPQSIRAHAHDLGPQLEPALLEACGGRLRDVRWFRTDWQRGGAATAFAEVLLGEDGSEETREAVVKLPLGPREYRAMTMLQGEGNPAPRVAFHGTELGGWDLGWVVMERLPGNPLAAHLHKGVFEELAHAAARFYKCAGEAWKPIAAHDEWDWAGLLEKARESAKINPIPQGQSWANHIHDVQRSLPALLELWLKRDMTTWCHGDLHPGNLMQRPEGSAWGEPGAVLLDFAEVHCGHWVEDAVYLERQYWAKPEALEEVKPVSLIARARRKLGLATDDDYATLATIRRVLMASVAPAFLERDGHPKYLEAALGILDRFYPPLVKSLNT